ncbi:MAG: S8/S53 family peptidase [Pseudomonadota bacterium]
MADAVVIVIEDPRASLRRIGAGPGYGLPSAYADDPLLKRRSAAIARDYDLSIIDEWPLRNLGVHCFAIERPSAAVLAAIDRDERIKWLQPFNEFALQSNQSTTSATSENCALCQFKAQFDSPGRNITIAVIDTAVDTDHPDLRRSSLVTRNFAGPRGNPDEEDHGTAVVGLINAIPSTEHGVDGLAPAARVHLLRGCWQDNNAQGRCNTLTLALALDAAVDLAPDILNLSLTGRQDRLLDELLGKLLANGTLVFAAHDEQRKAEERFPARQLGVVYAYGVEETVAASAPSDPNVLYAPRHALSLATMGGYDLVSGHSIATPQLAAMAARLMEHDASRSRADTIQTLKDWLKDYYGALFAE